MRRVLALLVSLATCRGVPAAVDVEAKAPVIPRAARQLVVGTSEGWTATAIVLRRYERVAGGPWRPVGGPVSAVVGYAGLGWGRGLHGDGAPAGQAGPGKAEGDGRAPAGAFALGRAFGHGDGPPPGTRLPYVAMTEGWRCVDDLASARYNQVFDATGVTPDWASAETMRRGDALHQWGLEIAHNAPAPIAGRGSCIFFHVRGDAPDGATVGCTALGKGELAELIAWLDPAAAPVYVLLPEAAYAAVAASWGLPN